MVTMAPTLVPDGFIYLRATPQTCMSRLMNRNRDEEAAVHISYLEDLHKRHDDWLYQIHENSDPNIKPAFQQVPPKNACPQQQLVGSASQVRVGGADEGLWGRAARAGNSRLHQEGSPANSWGRAGPRHDQR